MKTIDADKFLECFDNAVGDVSLYRIREAIKQATVEVPDANKVLAEFLRWRAAQHHGWEPSLSDYADKIDPPLAAVSLVKCSVCGTLIPIWGKCIGCMLTEQKQKPHVHLGDKFTDPSGVVWELIENPMSNRCVLINEAGEAVPLIPYAEQLPLPPAGVFVKPEHWKPCK